MLTNADWMVYSWDYSALVKLVVLSMIMSFNFFVSAWLTSYEHPVIERINQRIEDLTGLEMDTAEELQVSSRCSVCWRSTMWFYILSFNLANNMAVLMLIHEVFIVLACFKFFFFYGFLEKVCMLLLFVTSLNSFCMRRSYDKWIITPVVLTSLLG